MALTVPCACLAAGHPQAQALQTYGSSSRPQTRPTNNSRLLFYIRDS